MDIEQHLEPIPVTIRLPDGRVLHRLITHTIGEPPGEVTHLLARPEEYPAAMATKGSEFGGVPGKIAPLPHELTSAELARLERAIDPMDASSSAEDQRIVEARREGRSTIANPDGFTGEANG